MGFDDLKEGVLKKYLLILVYFFRIRDYELKIDPENLICRLFNLVTKEVHDFGSISGFILNNDYVILTHD